MELKTKATWAEKSMSCIWAHGTRVLCSKDLFSSAAVALLAAACMASLGSFLLHSYSFPQQTCRRACYRHLLISGASTATLTSFLLLQALLAQGQPEGL